MDLISNTVAAEMKELVSRKGLQSSVNVILNSLLVVCDRRELYAGVANWVEDNAVLALPPLGEKMEEATETTRSTTPTSASSSETGTLAVSSRTSGSSTGGTPPVLKANLPPNGVVVPGKRRPPSQQNNKANASKKQQQSKCPPWLAYSGLPSDGSIDTATEIQAYVSFVGATESEIAARSSMRTSLQKLVQLLVSPEAILKVIGSWATGLATFNSTLDLVVECPYQDNILESIQSVFADLGVSSTFALVSGFSALRLTSESLTHAVWQQQVLPHNKNAHGDFSVNIFADASSSKISSPINSRYITTKIGSRLNKFSENKRTAFVIRGIIDKTNLGTQPGGISGHIVLLLILAHFEENKHQSSFADPGWVLREFFRFYSTFDFVNHSINPTPLAGESVFIPKVHPGDQLSIIDPLRSGFNSAMGVTKLPQLVGTLQYLSMLIQRYDRDPRGTPLLPNLVACGEQLWKRHTWLRRGIDINKNLAVSVAKGVADFLEDPTNISAKEELLSVAAWDSNNNMLSMKLQLIQRIVSKAHSPLSHFRGHVPQLVEALSRFKDEPEVQEHYQRSLRNTISKDLMISVVKEIADFITQPLNHGLREEIRRIAFLGEGSPSQDNAHPIACYLFTKASENPNSVLWEFKSCIEQLVKALRGSAYSHEPEVQVQRLRIMGAMVTPEIAAKVSNEAVEYFENPDNEEEREELVRSIIVGCDTPTKSTEEWSEQKNLSASVAVLAKLRQNPNSVIKSVQDEGLPVLAKILNEFNDLPEVRLNRQRAVCASVTGDIAFAIANDVLRFVRDPDNLQRVKQIGDGLLNGVSGGREMAELGILLEIAKIPGSRLSDFKNVPLDEFRELKKSLERFKNLPEIVETKKKIARRIFQVMASTLPSRIASFFFRQIGEDNDPEDEFKCHPEDDHDIKPSDVGLD
eukprot:TRINITY_DN3215_c0_g1_i1.p1 TRINITY_DN3215_c0_g1~~TRINITY_DN3215_c0_g1_i1.p1  ORF type:complete len:923 (+),score=187.92 TRINITY_DN3215_c0_g1_i1:113-2881(+)